MRALVASRCVLEPQKEVHAAEMFVVLSDPAIYEFENKPPSSEAWLANRYARLERRVSPDGSQIWLNWVVRIPNGGLVGYVQATVIPSGSALIAYELASRHWRQGIGRSAVSAMLAELQSGYGVRVFAAILKRANYRSLGLLRSLGFQEGTESQRTEFGPEADELVMAKMAVPANEPVR